MSESPLQLRRSLFNEEHDAYRDSVRRFLAREVSPHYLRWEEERAVPRSAFQAAAAGGFLAMSVPAEYGGAGVDDFRFNVVLAEECLAAGVGSFLAGIGNISNVCLPYFLRYTTPEQKQRWLPGIARGELLVAIAMTEPGGGSDLAALRTTAVRDGDMYRVSGAKTFISNGINADLVMAAVRTDPAARKAGISLIVVERGTPGFERGRKLDKLGLHAQDTAELFFNDAQVPAANLLGIEGEGFRYMMSNLPQERLAIGNNAIAASRAVIGWTIRYVKERMVFGKPVAAYQNTRMVLAELRTEIEIGQTFIDRCIEALMRDELTAEQAAMAKWWATELQGRVTDRCLQLHGGYGYMREFPVARAYVDARVSRIIGGTTEIMKEIIGRADGLR
jgi:alkylation response protein AidB-like acyl-CoA dehydrogenase